MPRPPTCWSSLVIFFPSRGRLSSIPPLPLHRGLSAPPPAAAPSFLPAHGLPPPAPSLLPAHGLPLPAPSFLPAHGLPPPAPSFLPAHGLPPLPPSFLPAHGFFTAPAPVAAFPDAGPPFAGTDVGFPPAPPWGFEPGVGLAPGLEAPLPPVLFPADDAECVRGFLFSVLAASPPLSAGRPRLLLPPVVGGGGMVGV